MTPHDYFSSRRYEASLQHELSVAEHSLLRTSLFAYEMSLNQRLQDFDRSVQPGIEYESIPDPAALLLRKTASLRSRVYDVFGLSTELEPPLQPGAAQHRL